jgi:hypothetical protein
MENEGSSGPTHTTGTRSGEDIKSRDGQEAGRDDGGTSHNDRPTGTRTARDSTSINPENVEAVDSDAPKIPPA